MPKHARIYVVGHTGLVGSALVRKLKSLGHRAESLILQTHAELDLTDQAATRAFFQKEKPEYVFLAAAKAGGIYANSTYPAEFVHENLAIQTNVIYQAWRAGVKRLLFLGSSSDAFFPFRDGIDAAAEAGVRAIVQPGGSVRDVEIIEAANKHAMTMVLTGQRLFRH